METPSEAWTKEYQGRTKPSYDEIVEAVKDIKTVEELNECIKQNMWEEEADDVNDIHLETTGISFK